LEALENIIIISTIESTQISENAGGEKIEILIDTATKPASGIVPSISTKENPLRWIQARF
jgi:hypothetical protein